MNTTNVLALFAGIGLAVAMLASGIGISDWQFWLAVGASALAFLSGQMHGRATKGGTRPKRAPANWPWA
ncbi:hypothetical protein [Paraburkholderia tropica]|uniref:hypothetical protein n=1 Tax=Paraburkholderia tropica TaxID=92647 RepID=UPI002AB7BD25|nr:hypothetical protein [Paraburkholderia tropica]